jgi:hypothetical protein
MSSKAAILVADPGRASVDHVAANLALLVGTSKELGDCTGSTKRCGGYLCGNRSIAATTRKPAPSTCPE